MPQNHPLEFQKSLYLMPRSIRAGISQKRDAGQLRGNLCSGGKWYRSEREQREYHVCRARSLDHPVGADQHGLWNREAHRLGGLEIDH